MDVKGWGLPGSPGATVSPLVRCRCWAAPARRPRHETTMDPITFCRHLEFKALGPNSFLYLLLCNGFY